MTAWASFFLATALGALVLAVPGYLILRLLGMGSADSLCAGPAIGAALLTVLAIVFEPLGVHADIVTLFLVPVAVLAVTAIVSGRLRMGVADGSSSLDLTTVALYGVIGFCVGMYVFVKSLDGPASYFLGWDAIRHINGVQAFAESGNMSTLSSSLYETPADATSSPITNRGSFYPSGWYVVAALMAQQFSHTSVMAVNASNFLFSSIVYPLSMAPFVSRVFPDDGDALVRRAGAFVTPCFAAFPWMFYAYGPLYPNAAAMALLPSVASLWMDVVGYEGPARLSAGTLAAAVLGAMGMTLVHPGALFSLGIVGMAFIACRIYQYGEDVRIFGASVSPKVCSVVFSLSFWSFWMLATRLPFLRGVTSYSWNPFSTVPKMVINVLSLAYTHRWVPAVAPQPIMAALLLAGLVACSRKKETTWASLLYGIVCVMLIIGATTGGVIRSSLIGYWYNDHNRVAAMCAVFGVPLAAKGLAMACEAALKMAGNRQGRIIPAAVCCATTALVLCPSFELPGFGWVDTAFGMMRYQLTVNQEPGYGPVHEDERDFMEKVMEIVPDGAVVANYPYDGSIALYGAYDLHVLYRYMAEAPSAGEKTASVVLRESLDSLASSDEVRAAVDELGIEYVIRLHTDNLEAMYPGIVESAAEENWVGILSIRPDTPGFELVLSQGDLELYRVL